MREQVSLRHKVIQLIKLGRLQTVTRIPTLPGDSLNGSINVFIRFNPLRRPIPFDCKVDMYCFWNPYRWTYPNWYGAAFMGRGGPTIPVATVTPKVPLPSLLINNNPNAPIPAHIPADYVRIYNHFFLDPHDPDVVLTDLVSATSSSATDNTLYGFITGAPKSYQTATMGGQGIGATGDRIMPLVKTGTDPANTFTLDVSQLPLSMQKWREGQVIEWMGERFEERFKKFFGTPPPEDIEKVPHFLGSTSKTMSAWDVDGTSGDQFGSAIGKMTGYCRFQLPRRFFREHGSLTCYIVARPDILYNKAKHYLDDPAHLGHYETAYGTMEGKAQLPTQVTGDELFWDGFSAAAGYHPALQHYRSQVGFVHPHLSEVSSGWEGRPTPSGPRGTRYMPGYDDIFTTVEGGHAQLICEGHVTARRVIGSPTESVFGDAI